jgi:hypothetical protein
MPFNERQEVTALALLWRNVEGRFSEGDRRKSALMWMLNAPIEKPRLGKVKVKLLERWIEYSVRKRYGINTAAKSSPRHAPALTGKEVDDGRSASINDDYAREKEACRSEILDALSQCEPAHKERVVFEDHIECAARPAKLLFGVGEQVFSSEAFGEHLWMIYRAVAACMHKEPGHKIFGDAFGIHAADLKERFARDQHVGAAHSCRVVAVFAFANWAEEELLLLPR